MIISNSPAAIQSDSQLSHDILVKWPPPMSLRPALRAARRRYHKARPEDRPALDYPPSCIGLFPLRDLLTLARPGCWPLPPRARHYIAEAPPKRTRRRRRRDQRMSEIARDVMTADLAAAVAVLTRRATP
jgi:hypothetical protein